MREYPLFIDGKDIEGSGWTYVLRTSQMLRDPIGSFNLKRGLETGRYDGPIPDAVEARCAWGDRELSRAAIRAAANAREGFSRIPLDTRIEMVRQIRQGFIDNLDELIELLVIEGHPRRLAQWELSGPIRVADDPTLEWYRAQFDSSFETDGCRVQLVRKPDGVVCVNPPQNAAGSNGSLGVLALLAGNTLVVKAPRSTPLTVMHIYRNIVQPVLEAYGAPAGTLNLISGDSRDIMRDWLASPDVDDILFFGGSDVGLQVGRDCTAAGKKAILELAGNDGFVVWKDADLAAAATALSECFYGSAQICMVPKYAIIHPEIADEFIAMLRIVVDGISPGYPEDPTTLLSPVLKADQFFDFLNDAEAKGAEILCGGARIDVHGRPAPDGLFLQPTLIKVDGFDKAAELSCVTEETFFPMLPLVVPEAGDNLLEATIAFLDRNAYGLRNSLRTRSPAVAEEVARNLTTGGQLKINDSHLALHSYLATHGGTGRTGGPHGELNYVALRTSHLQGILWGTGKVAPIDPIFSTR